MTSDIEWSAETYRLCEIEGKFDFPCVIRVNEGFYSESDSEGFSQGDILSIDSKMVLQKVAASFKSFTDVNASKQFDDESVVESKNEILVPLNYKGKLKVIRSSKNYENVNELATDFPRYATLRQDLNVSTEENERVTIKSGTVIELVRIVPGSISCSSIPPGKITIQFQRSGRHLTVALPLNTSGKFRTEVDNNEYTIKEALDRYNLPLHVRFVDDNIKRVYTQDLLEGIENMNIITETLRLNRLVEQTVLVGHYKRVGKSNDTEKFRKRTLVVLPMNNPHICETNVNVSTAVIDNMYEQVFLVRNVSNDNTEDTVDGSLYVDFRMKPGVKLISQEDDENHGDLPPPRPPKPANLAPKVGPKPRPIRKGKQKSLSLDSRYVDDVKGNKSDDDDYLVPKPRPGLKPGTIREEKQKSLSLDSRYFDACKDDKGDDDTDDDDYIVPKPRSVLDTDDHSTLSEAKTEFTQSDKDTPKCMSLKKKICRKVVDNITNIKSSFRGLTVLKYRRGSDVSETRPEHCGHTSAEDDHDVEKGLYDDINETTMLDFTGPESPTSSAPDRKRYKDSYLRAVKYYEKKDKPMALVQPVKVNPTGKKPFKDLNNQELVDRLRQCGLTEISDFCKKEGLDGSFFSNLPKEALEKDMNIKGIQLAKFIQMRDLNWVPVEPKF